MKGHEWAALTGLLLLIAMPAAQAADPASVLAGLGREPAPEIRTQASTKTGPAHLELEARVALVGFVPGAGQPDAPAPEAPPAEPRVRAAAGAFALALVLAYGARIQAWLLAAGPLALFTRIEPERVLDNGVRQRIHEAVARNPGITPTEVAHSCGVGWGTAVFHLGRLESHGLVSSERHRRRRRYFARGTGIANGTKAAYAELLDPTSRRIAIQVLERPGTAQKELAESLGLRTPRACKHLAALVGTCLLSRERAARRVRYFPTPQLADLFRMLDAPALSPPTSPLPST